METLKLNEKIDEEIKKYLEKKSPKIDSLLAIKEKIIAMEDKKIPRAAQIRILNNSGFKISPAYYNKFLKSYIKIRELQAPEPVKISKIPSVGKTTIKAVDTDKIKVYNIRLKLKELGFKWTNETWEIITDNPESVISVMKEKGYGYEVRQSDN